VEPIAAPSRVGMSEIFTMETFLPRVGEVFHVVVNEQEELLMLLTEVAALADEGSSVRRRQPFALIFHAAPGSYVPQDTYRVENDAMEPFDCFIVPLGPDKAGARFEAIYT
jgi:hypothetical protein